MGLELQGTTWLPQQLLDSRLLESRRFHSSGAGRDGSGRDGCRGRNKFGAGFGDLGNGEKKKGKYGKES